MSNKTDGGFLFEQFTTFEEDREDWRDRLKALFWFPIVSVIIGLLVAMLFVPSVFLAKAAAQTSLSIWQALPKNLDITPAPQRSVILDRHGNEFAQFFAENRVVLTGDQIPKVMRDAQVSIEDTRFYEREGTLDMRALMRALAGNILRGGGYGGGSTITQQYVKNMLLNNATTKEQQEAATERSISRKVQEMSLAIEVEKNMSREDILVGYLNIANYGDGTFGIEAASRHYFSVPASQLTLSQAATLAGVVQNPSRNPVTEPSHSTQRRNHVLQTMLAAGRITEAEYESAKAEKLVLNLSRPDNGCTKSAYPYYCELVRSTLRNDPAFGATEQARERLLFRGGLTIHTAMDPAAMKVANEAAKNALGNNNQFAAGVAIVQPGTGHVLGFGQNRTFDQTQVSYANSSFQNGSTFKPITLAAALEDGWDMNQTLNAPTFITKGGKTFGNVSRNGAGRMNAADALAVSSNTFFVKMETEVTTVAKTQEMARRLGVPIPSSATGTEPSTTLGVYDVSPIQTANYFATFAAHGVHCRPTLVTKVTVGSTEMSFDSQCHQELEPGLADTVAHALATVVDGPNESRTGKAMTIGRPAMGKTGTTTGNSSVWFAGGTPQYATAVWIGDPRGGFKYPVNRLKVYGKWLDGVYGSTAAGPIWTDVMSRLHQGLPVQNFGNPSTVKQTIVVPDVRGMSTTSAISVLQDAGLTVNINSDTDASVKTPDTVVSQSLAPGSSLSRNGGIIVLTLSVGSNTFIEVER